MTIVCTAKVKSEHLWDVILLKEARLEVKHKSKTQKLFSHKWLTNNGFGSIWNQLQSKTLHYLNKILFFLVRNETQNTGTSVQFKFKYLADALQAELVNKTNLWMRKSRYLFCFPLVVLAFFQHFFFSYIKYFLFPQTNLTKLNP